MVVGFYRKMQFAGEFVGPGSGCSTLLLMARKKRMVESANFGKRWTQKLSMISFSVWCFVPVSESCNASVHTETCGHSRYSDSPWEWTKWIMHSQVVANGKSGQCKHHFYDEMKFSDTAIYFLMGHCVICLVFRWALLFCEKGLLVLWLIGFIEEIHEIADRFREIYEM